MSCTVCDEDCDARFFCEKCGRLFPVCNYRIGGFDLTIKEDICVACYEARELSARVQRKLRREAHKYDHKDRTSKLSSTPTSKQPSSRGTDGRFVSTRAASGSPTFSGPKRN